MKTKEEYITEIVKIYEHLLASPAGDRLSHLNNEIIKVRNISDEEYDKILKYQIEEKTELKKEEIELEKRLSKIGMTLEDFENTTEEICIKYIKEEKRPFFK